MGKANATLRAGGKHTTVDGWVHTGVFKKATQDKCNQGSVSVMVQLVAAFGIMHAAKAQVQVCMCMQAAYIRRVCILANVRSRPTKQLSFLARAVVVKCVMRCNVSIYTIDLVHCISLK